MSESSNHAPARPVTVTPELRVVRHVPVCPECRSESITIDQVAVDGIEETAYICDNPDCGAVWPLACVCEWS
jgi:hypothetical protein